MPTLPELTIIDLLNSIVERVKQTRPTRTNGKPLSGSGMVYSQLVSGMPIDKDDYNQPWSPMGGASAGQQAGVPAGQPDKVAAAMMRAFNTSRLCATMLQITNDGSYQEYPVGRQLDFAYSGVISAMQPQPVDPPPPDVQQAVNDAMKVLYDMDMSDPANPAIEGISSLHKKYRNNSVAYAQAKADYAMAKSKAMADPLQANIWPQISAPLQAKADDAYDTWKTEGADKVERALAVIESQGINIQQAQIAKAKKLYDIWSLGLAGVPTDVPYSFILPSEWADPDADDIGFEKLQIKRTSESHAADAVQNVDHSMWWNKEQSSTDQSGHIGFWGIRLAESSHDADQNAADAHKADTLITKVTSDHFTDMEVSLEWALVSIYRPWLVSDLFYMKNWYIQGKRANCVSDGRIETQLGITDQLLPLIPQQMLVIRNVTITSNSWGDFGNDLKTLYSGDQNSTDASQSSQHASGFGVGPIAFGKGNYDHADDKAKGQGSDYSDKHAASSSGKNFDGTTLTINGAQVIAFLSDIVPPSPSMDDPALPKLRNKDTTTSAPGLTPTTASPPK